MGPDSEGAPRLLDAPIEDLKQSGRFRRTSPNAAPTHVVGLEPTDSPSTWQAAVRGLIGSNQEMEAIAVALSAPFDELKAQAVSLLAKRLQNAARRTEQGRHVFEPASIRMLERMLSDPASAIREEAKRVCLSLDVGGSEEATLRILLGSRFPDIRAHVLATIRDRVDEAWWLDLVLEMLDDSDALLRAGAFGVAANRGKGKGIQHLTWVLSGPHVGLKRLAVEELGERQGYAVEMLLARALADSDVRVARAAVEVMARNGADHLLMEALAGPNEDVRLPAARALVSAGHEEGLETLLAFVKRSAPSERARNDAWVQELSATLDAFGKLGDPDTASVLESFVGHKSVRVRSAAVRALVQVGDRKDGAYEGLLRDAHGDSAAQVRREAAIGLALLGDAACFSDLSWEHYEAKDEALLALGPAVALVEQAPALLLGFADHGDPGVRSVATLLALMVDFARGEVIPKLCKALLSCKESDSRLTATKAIAPLTLHQGEQHLHRLVADRGELRSARSVSPETARDLAALLAHSSPQMRVRAVGLVTTLLEDQVLFTRTWERFFEAQSDSMREAVARMNRHQAAARRRSVEDFTALVANAPNAMVTLKRRAGPAGRTEPARIARVSEALHHVAGPLLLLACCDPAPQVREAASDGLTTMGLDPSHFGLTDHAALSRALRTLQLEPESAPAPVEAIPTTARPPATARPPSEEALLPSTPLADRVSVVQDANETGVFERVSDDPKPDTRTIRLAGEIVERAAICDIIAFLGQSGWRGELKVDDDRHQRAIFFDAGNVVGASTTNSNERLGEVMYRFGVIGAEQREQIEALLKHGRQFGQAAVELGFVKEERLYSLMGEQISTIVFGAFGVARGKFWFYDGFDEERLASRHALGATQLLMAGLSQQDETELYRTKIPSNKCVPERKPGQKSPPSALVDIFELVDGVRSVEALGRASGLGDFVVTKKLFELIQSRHVVVPAPQVESKLADIVHSVNDALLKIHEAVDASADAARYREAVTRSKAAHQLAAQGLVLQPSGTIDIQQMELEAGWSGVDESGAAKLLNAYVGTALITAEAQLGSARERMLREQIKANLDVLRPAGGTIAPGAPDSEPPSSSRFHIKMLGDS